MKSILFLLLFLPFCSQAQIIVTVAGNGESGYTGDGGPATNARLDSPHGVLIDNEGNLIICDVSNRCIRKVSPPYNGIISTIVGDGTGLSGFAGDGLPATVARISGVLDVAIDKKGNLYLADADNNRLRMVDTNGIIHTIAGTGTAGYNGDGIPATSAQLNQPITVAIDHIGNIYIGDRHNYRIRKIDTFGIIHTVLGTGTLGFSPDGSHADTVSLNNIVCIRTDMHNNLYFTDNIRLRKMNPSGIISTVVGTGVSGFSGDGGMATSAQVKNLAQFHVDTSGSIYVADVNNRRIRKVNPEGVINTIAGSGTYISLGDGGNPLLAWFVLPNGVTVAPNGDIFISDQGGARVRMISNHITGIELTEVSDTDVIQLYPNPTKENCTILVNTDATKSVNIIITYIAGREVHRCIGVTRQPITLATCWQPGIYTISATTATEQHTTTIVVQ